jgi:hypothetical protein
MTMLERAQGVRRRIEMLAVADAGRRVFGASKHGYRVSVQHEDGAIERLEAAVGTPVSDAHRALLRVVGDGGAGPYYGLLSVEESLARITRRSGMLAGLARDCPLESDVPIGELVPQEPTWAEHVSRLESDPASEDRFDELAAHYGAPPFSDGVLPICDYGCGDFFFLVMRGPKRGSVWANCLDGATGLFNLDVDVLGFVERWLDRAETQVRAKDFKPHGVAYGFLEFGNSRCYGARAWLRAPR